MGAPGSGSRLVLLVTRRRFESRGGEKRGGEKRGGKGEEGRGEEDYSNGEERRRDRRGGEIGVGASREGREWEVRVQVRAGVVFIFINCFHHALAQKK